MFDQVLSHGCPMIPWCLPPISYYKFYLKIPSLIPGPVILPDPLVGGSSSMPNSFHFFPFDLRIQRIQGSTLSSLLEHLLLMERDSPKVTDPSLIPETRELSLFCVLVGESG